MTPVIEERPFGPDGELNLTAPPRMTLRDWFAGQALASMTLAGPYALTQQNREVELYLKEAAASAYRYADAMLEERRK